MRVLNQGHIPLVLLAAFAASAPAGVFAQSQELPPADISKADLSSTVASGPVDNAALPKGPEIRGFISRRSADRIEVTVADGTKSVINVNDYTKITASKGLFGISRQSLAANALLNGLPVTVRTLQSGDALMASEILFKGSDFKTATMIRTGTAQGFDEQTAATEALRGRMGDIDQYNIKSTTNVNFDFGKSALSPQAKADLCASAAASQGVKNALLLVVGYTDSVGSEEVNQRLSEQRAARVVNYMQQACGWKPWRMLTPTGMAMADPLADNSTPEGKAQNRRVSVNVLVSKGLDGL